MSFVACCSQISTSCGQQFHASQLPTVCPLGNHSTTPCVFAIPQTASIWRRVHPKRCGEKCTSHLPISAACESRTRGCGFGELVVFILLTYEKSAEAAYLTIVCCQKQRFTGNWWVWARCNGVSWAKSDYRTLSSIIGNTVPCNSPILICAYSILELQK